MPVRVEKRRDPDGVHYRIVGIVWGGDRPADRLDDSFRARTTRGSRSRSATPRQAAGVWTLWEYRWTPPAAGVYSIALRIPDALGAPAAAGRRLLHPAGQIDDR